ncbi:hypothetical protein D9619_001558 [Psilocybe cf. subviscida]|uniref:EXS domain-containing protein n=1 Tax=Psilocybe cf. subviscida TaxID=2480587 RepID=A0A8H5BFF4_9AGAR|nr:hypothetical protein D9619_001558 [Psilocybe cf. subviscida]
MSDSDEIYLHASFPIPYRALTLLSLGILGWATNVHGLHKFGVDVVSTMDLRADASARSIPTHNLAAGHHPKPVTVYRTIYSIFSSFSIFSFLSWCLYRMNTRGDRTLVDYYGYIPVITVLAILLVLVCPYNVMFKEERDRFLLSIRRCVFPPTGGPIYFSDVIFADIGTSFAKVFGELWLSLWMLKPGNSILVPPVEDGLSRWVFPTVLAIPFFLRFRQCVIEYTAPSNTSQRPLYNALKYATSFPVIFLSAAQRFIASDIKHAADPWPGEHYLFRLWLLAAIVNSLYSFWWDVTNDWGLELLKIDSPRKSPRQPPRQLVLGRLYSGTPLISRSSLSLDSSSSDEAHVTAHEARASARVSPPPKLRYRQSCTGLRPVVMYPRAVYPVLIFLNLFLRMTWSVKLSTHVASTRDGTFGFFWLEVAEIFRRWLWVFVRVEWEMIKRAQEKLPTYPLQDSTEDGLDYEMVPATPEMAQT